ncbi:MAG: hypothetical protein ACFB0D_11785, partial [Phormidesmis sp.]
MNSVNANPGIESMPSLAQLSIRNVTKVFSGKKDLFSKLTKKTSRDFTAIEDITFDIQPNTLVSFIGPSG